MKEFPKYESDEIDRKNIRANLDQYSQLDHHENAKKFIEYMDAIKDTKEVITSDAKKYALLESLKGFDIEKTVESIIEYIESNNLTRESVIDFNSEGFSDRLKELVAGFLDPEINESANNNFGKCCDLINCRITIPSENGISKDVDVKNIIAKNTFLKHMKKIIEQQEELDCEIPSLIRFRVSDGELFLKEIVTHATPENTIILKDECFKKSKDGEEKTPSQRMLDILSEYIDKKDKESTREKLNKFTKSELYNAFDGKYYSKIYNQMLGDGENKELSVVDQILKTDKEQVSSRGHCRISDKIRRKIDEKKFILLHTHPTETTISPADSKHGYSLILRIGDRLVKSQVIASSDGDEFSIYFKDQSGHRRIKVKDGSIYEPGEVSLQLFDIMIANIKSK